VADKCPMCNSDVEKPTYYKSNGTSMHSYSCPRCGKFDMQYNFSHQLPMLLNNDIKKIAVLSNWIRTRYEVIAKEPTDEQFYRKTVTVHTENKAFLCHCEAFRPKQSQKRTILDCFASLAMTKMRFSRERLRKTIILDEQLMNSIIKNPPLSPAEQADNFVRWIGDNVQSGGQYIEVHKPRILAVIGSIDEAEF